MFSLIEIRPQVFHLRFDSRRELGMAFLRYTEFYESKYDHLREHKFTLVQQQSAYCRDHLGSPDADWSYTSDWSGYNIPASVIKDVHDLGIPDPNHYDALMAGVYGMIQGATLGKKAYLIGTTTDAEVSTLNHELTHAMYYLDDAYSSAAGDLIYKSPARILLEKALYKAGYPRKVAVDEIQAYLTTGKYTAFDELECQGEIAELKAKLSSLHFVHFAKFTGRALLSSEEIEGINKIVENPPVPSERLKKTAAQYRRLLQGTVFSDD